MLNLKLKYISIIIFAILCFIFRSVFCATELVFFKDVDLVQVKPYEILTFTLFYSNSGNDYATNAIVTDYLPNHTQYLKDTAETNNQFHSGTADIQYWALSSWRSDMYDNTNGNETNINKIKWHLNNIIQPGDYGSLSYKVIIK